MAVSFKCTDEEVRIIRQIAKRAIKTIQGFRAAGVDRFSIELTVRAVHANGCPLDLTRLLKFDDFNFAHDILGFRRHLNRNTGQLGAGFRPRCALPARRRAA